MLQTQRQATVNLGSARAALILAAAFAAAVVVGQIDASNPFAASTTGTGTGDAVAAPFAVVPEITTRSHEQSLAVTPEVTTHNHGRTIVPTSNVAPITPRDGAGRHKGGLLPQ